GFRLAVLDRDLHMVESRIGKLAEPLIRDADTGGDEIGVKTGVARRRHDVDEIAPRRRLAAGEVDLQYPEPRSLAKHPRPGGSVELALPLVHLEGIRAVRAAERTAMGEFGEQAKRAVERLRRLAVAASMSIRATVGGHGITVPKASCLQVPATAWRH